MIPGKPWIEIHDRGQRRLRKEFDDKRIHWGFNKKTKEFQAWYTPASSAPYMITNATTVEHAAHLLRGRLKHDKMSAKDMIREMDEQNDKVLSADGKDAMLEMRSELKQIAKGKRFFGPWSQRG
jgi:hypothetical protein